MIMSIELSYDWQEKIAKLGREKYAELREQLDWLTNWPPERDKPEYMIRDNILIDLETDGRVLLDNGIDFIVKRMKNNYFVDQAFEKARKLRNDSEILSASSVHVHIPNLGLFIINEVDWLEDACTQDLQRRLDDGWRILAVCPPQAQRRPDYILGRSKD